MSTQLKTIVRIPSNHGDGRFKSWARDLTGVDESETNAYAFEFDQWLEEGRKQELEVGSYILLYGEEGSRQYHDPHVKVCRVDQDGSLDTVIDHEGQDWALDIRDDVAELLSKDADLDEPFDPDLDGRVVHAFGHRYLVTSEDDPMMGGETARVRAEHYQADAKLTGGQSTDPQDPTYGGGEERVMQLLHWIEDEIGSDRTVYAGIATSDQRDQYLDD
jgi:hypothetical protein